MIIRRTNLKGAIIQRTETAWPGSAHRRTRHDRLDQSIHRCQGHFRAHTSDRITCLLAHARFSTPVRNQCHAAHTVGRDGSIALADSVSNVAHNHGPLGEADENEICERTFVVGLCHLLLRASGALRAGFVIGYLLLGVNVLELRHVRQGPHPNVIGWMRFLERTSHAQHVGHRVEGGVVRVIC